MSAAGDLLARYLIDDAFRRAFDDDPERVLAQHDLEDDERAALLARDERVLALIGRAVGAPKPSSEPSPEPSPVRAPDPPPPTAELELPPIAVWLSVLPRASEADGATRVRWQVSLHAEPPDEQEIAAQHGVAFRIDLEPATTTYRGAERVVFRSTIGPHESTSAAAPIAPSWDHDTESPDVAAAVERVRLAEPTERFQAVLELAHALRLRT